MDENAQRNAAYIWRSTLEGFERAGSERRNRILPLAILVAGDFVHPELGVNYLDKKLAEDEKIRIIDDRDLLASDIYGNTKAAIEKNKIGEAKRIASASKYQCVFVCENQEAVKQSLDYLSGLGADEPSFCDSDEFQTEEFCVTTFTETYSYFAT